MVLDARVPGRGEEVNFLVLGKRRLVGKTDQVQNRGIRYPKKDENHHHPPIQVKE